MSVIVKFAEPVSRAGLPGLVALPFWKSRRTNFWWKIFGLKSPLTSMSERSSAARILRFAARSVSSSSHWTRRSAVSAVSPDFGVGAFGGVPRSGLRR